MIRIEDTKNMLGITIHGDYQDLNALRNAISNFLEIYFDHQTVTGHYHCYECILGLCYDIRHAFQGDRNIEKVENNYESIGHWIDDFYEGKDKSLLKERNKYKNGNLYFNVEVLYPWAIFYLYTLQYITDDCIRKEWIDEVEWYDEYQAERDLSLIRYFIQLLWIKLKEHLPKEVMKTIWDYTVNYNQIEYYFSYPDHYIEWLCTYWLMITNNKKERMKMLPLLCLELSAISTEIREDVEEELEELKKEIEERTKNLSDLEKASELSFHNYFIEQKNNTITGTRLYEKYLDEFSKNKKKEYLSLFDYLDYLDDYTEKHGPFSKLTFEDWLDKEFKANWDNLKW